MCGPRWLILVLLLAATAPTLAGHAQTDVIQTDDGSTFIGEIKSVQYATLNLDTSAAGLLSIEWRHVRSITSKFQFRAELHGGLRYFGTLEVSKKPGHLLIATSTGPVEVSFEDVFEIVPFGHGFWKRLDGSLNFGLTYTQSNRALQYNVNTDVLYRTRKNYAELYGQSILISQEAADTTHQSQLNLLLGQAGKHAWGTFEVAQIQRNPDQGYELRTIVGGGAVRPFVESARQMLSLNLGMVYNREKVTGAGGVDNSAEALAGVGYRRFKRGSHSPSVQFNLSTFTNVTDTPRFRLMLYSTLSWKLIGNFKFNFQVNDSYDSDPPGTDAQKNDLSVVTSVGYSF